MLDIDKKKCSTKDKFNQLDEEQKSLKVLPDKLFDVNASDGRWKIDNDLFNDDDNLVVGFTACKSNDSNELQILKLNDSSFEYFLNKAGRLVSFGGEYELSRDFGDFCIDLAASLDRQSVIRVAVACNPCIHTTCIKTCCPHNASLTDKKGKCKNIR